MILQKLIIRNFRSFGNNINTLCFDNKGKLILVSGMSGSGKTSIRLALDFLFIDEVYSDGKKVTKTSLPNRLNGGMFVAIEFMVGSSNMYIEKTSKKYTFKIDGLEVDISKLYDYLPFDKNTWKLFISISIHDFHDFLNSKSDRYLVFDKILNINFIENVNKTVLSLKNEFKTSLDNYQNQINNYNKNILSIQEKLKLIQSTDIENSKNELLVHKNAYKKLQDDLAGINVLINDLNNEIKISNDYVQKAKTEYSILKNKNQLLSSGKCPTCENVISNNVLDSFNVDIEQIRREGVDLVKNHERLQANLIKLNETKNSYTNELNFVNKKCIDLNNNILSIEQKSNDISIAEIEQSKSDLVKKQELITKKYTNYCNLYDILKNPSIKNSIIESVIPIINNYIQDNISELNLKFNIKIDNSLNVVIKQYGDVVENSELSSGEARRINMIIMMSIINHLSNKKYVNIMFLDEILSAIDVVSINDILILINKFAKDFNLNIFLTHHALLENNLFDKIYHIEKDITSNIREK